MRYERRAEEGAGALLGDHDILGLRLELGVDGEIRCVNGRLVALGRSDQRGTALGADVARRIEDRKPGPARRSEQLPRGLDCRIRVFAAAARIGLRQLCRGTRAAPVDELVEI